MSVSPAQNFSKPPLVPAAPTVMSTSGFCSLKSSAAASLKGCTVLEPSILMLPESPLGVSPPPPEELLLLESSLPCCDCEREHTAGAQCEQLSRVHCFSFGDSFLGGRSWPSRQGEQAQRTPELPGVALSVAESPRLRVTGPWLSCEKAVNQRRKSPARVLFARQLSIEASSSSADSSVCAVAVPSGTTDASTPLTDSAWNRYPTPKCVWM